MSEQIFDYKCPACTGALRFDAPTGKLVCDYCDSIYSIEELEEKNPEVHVEPEAHLNDWEHDSDKWVDAKMKAYSCPSCGAEIVCDENTSATFCPYCGNNAIVPKQFDGLLKPDYIIPFKLDKKQAMEALKNHYKGKPLLPKVFSAKNHVEQIQGIYVPFWLFDGRADADMHFTAVTSATHREGDFQVTEETEYAVTRDATMLFERIPADASQKMPDDLMDSIEPYDYKDLVPFKSAYLPGFFAYRYDVDAKECLRRAVFRAEHTIRDSVHSDVSRKFPGAKYIQRDDVHVTSGKITYALLPVWVLHTKWKDEDYLFAMNGQTGKFVGDLPADMSLYYKNLLKIFAIAEAVIFLITQFL